MDCLATSWKGKAAYGLAVTKRSFGTLFDGVSLVHFHGHCVFSGDNILQQSLILSSGNEDEYVGKAADESRLDILHASNAQERSVQQSAVALENVTDIDLCPIIDEVGQNSILQLDTAVQTTRLTVEDIFALPLASSPLVTVVACDSATQTIATGDEPLGDIDRSALRRCSLCCGRIMANSE